MTLRIVEEREKFTFSDALDLVVWLKAFTPEELAALHFIHGDGDELTLVYETEVFSDGSRVKNIAVEAPKANPAPALKACGKCGSTNIFYDAVADQNEQLISVHDHYDCGDCEAERPELVEVSK